MRDLRRWPLPHCRPDVRKVEGRLQRLRWMMLASAHCLPVKREGKRSSTTDHNDNADLGQSPRKRRPCDSQTNPGNEVFSPFIARGGFHLADPCERSTFEVIYALHMATIRAILRCDRPRAAGGAALRKVQMKATSQLKWTEGALFNFTKARVQNVWKFLDVEKRLPWPAEVREYFWPTARALEMGTRQTFHLN